jgi:hypothetical protein
VDRQHPLHRLAPLPGHRQPVGDHDAADDADAVVVDDLADRLSLVALRIDLDLTRLQRARERAGQSAAGGGDDVVERRPRDTGTGRRHALVLGHLGVDADRNGLGLGRQTSQALRSAEALDPHAEHVCGLLAHT